MEEWKSSNSNLTLLLYTYHAFCYMQGHLSGPSLIFRKIESMDSKRFLNIVRYFQGSYNNFFSLDILCRTMHQQVFFSTRLPRVNMLRAGFNHVFYPYVKILKLAFFMKYVASLKSQLFALQSAWVKSIK